MKKTTKGALAAGSAAVLLMGGVGTLAYWNDSEDVDRYDGGLGQLDLALVACDDWQLDGTGGTGGDLGRPGDRSRRLADQDLHVHTHRRGRPPRRRSWT